MVMRKKSLVLLVFLFSAGILFAQADTAQTAEPGIKMFVSTWSTDGAQADIQFSNGYFQVHVETFDHGYEWNEWDYLCIYDENRQALIASNTGTKHAFVYDCDTDREAQNTIYQDGSAVFSLHPDGSLMWLDENEDAGQELRFAKMGNFSGIWQCDNVSINFHAIGGDYRCIVSKMENDVVTSQWTYHCEYDPESENVICNNLGRKEILCGYDEEGEIYDVVYHDGSAIFSINSTGYVVWNDLIENAGIDMLFVKNSFE